MSRLINKKRGFSELPLYRSMNMFLLFITPVIFNLSKDTKQTYGYEIIKIGIETIVKLKKCYYENNFDLKFSIADSIYNRISDMEMLFKLLFELGFVNEKTQSNISIQLGDILSQLSGWIKSIEKSINKHIETDVVEG